MVTEAASNSFQHSTKQKHGWIEAFDPILQTWEPLPDPPFIVTRNMPFLALESQKQILAIAYFIEEEDGNRMVLKTGPVREPEKGVVPVLVVRPGSDRWSNR